MRRTRRPRRRVGCPHIGRCGQGRHAAAGSSTSVSTWHCSPWPDRRWPGQRRPHRRRLLEGRAVRRIQASTNRRSQTGPLDRRAGILGHLEAHRHPLGERGDVGDTPTIRSPRAARFSRVAATMSRWPRPAGAEALVQHDRLPGWPTGGHAGELARTGQRQGQRGLEGLPPDKRAHSPVVARVVMVDDEDSPLSCPSCTARRRARRGS